MAEVVKRNRPSEFPAQHQDRQPGIESEMEPRPESLAPWYRGSGKLEDKVAIITGGDSGIGRSVAILFAREGADVVIVYLDEHEDAEEARRLVENEGRSCLTIAGDVGQKAFCSSVVDQTIEKFGRLDILVNNAAVQYVQESIEDIPEDQIERTFRTNIFSHFFLTQAAVPHMKEGSSIINSTSITAFRGMEVLLDYASTKGAILAFTRSLAQSLAKRGIRVNSVAPGPIWTPLIPASFPEDSVKDFGRNTLLGRAGQPEEVAPSYVFLASRDSSYITGQTIHPNGGQIVGA
jgi:NAD(P)-dependent dehydrogenase (short-subunit alcohol dehydrogenase family)